MTQESEAAPGQFMFKTGLLLFGLLSTDLCIHFFINDQLRFGKLNRHSMSSRSSRPLNIC